jgi:tryptophan synthase alpha subunit
MASISDGIVVGSAVVDLIKSSSEKGENKEITIKSCIEFVSKISNGLKHN